MSDYYDLGNHRRTISTDSPDAQLWFDRGLNWTYGFHHEEAIVCFEQALIADPNCAIAHWGIAYAAGPNYNKHWEQFDPIDLANTIGICFLAVERATALLEHASPPERALITALSTRYQSPTPPDAFEELLRWNDDYADAMRTVYREFGDDLDIVTLVAEALMNRTPWLLWDITTGEPMEGASTVEAQEMLERALATPASRVHPGVLHMYIHLMEMSPTPEIALRVGDDLRGLVPDAGHLEHMATHIDVLCGHYEDVVVWNHKAIVADRKYLERAGAMNFYSFYRLHNYHFKLYGAMFLGQEAAARDAADEMVSTIPEELLRVEVPPMADWMEHYLPLGLHVLIRFGRWQEIIDRPLPDDQALYCVTTTLLHYAKGIAYGALDQVPDAERERDLFVAALSRVPETRMLQNNVSVDILAVGGAMLEGELAYRKGHFEEAFAHLRHAVALEDGLPYAEPWAWMQPTRHALGALLLEQGQVEEAEAVYRADLGLDASLARPCQHPENVWALHGYHECLQRLGRDAEAHTVKQRLDRAMAHADVPIVASCACRLSAIA